MAEIPPSARRTIWTIGHSNHPWEAFFQLLGPPQIAVLADVRSAPYCRYATQFNHDVMAAALRAGPVEYWYLGHLLGGRVEGEQFCDEQGYVLYDRLAERPQFQQGIAELLGQLDRARLAILCSEEDPSACHRRLLIGRVLQQRGVEVRHIRGDGRIQSEDKRGAQQHAGTNRRR